MNDSTWLITGGTGSFGQKATEIILKEYSPKSIRVYSRSELLQIQMSQKIHDDRVRFFIGDIRDKERLSRACSGVDFLIHAAALKQVPVCEYNPIECVNTNILGTANVVDCCINNSIKKAILISSDKACSPVNTYGKSKAVAEALFVQGNVYAKLQTKFSCTRYGNVIASRGSVIPMFLEQKKTSVIKVTDENMTRFWLTLDQGVNFVLNCMNFMRGGEIFVPKIPSMKIVDLADIIAPGCKRLITGIRPGEKLNEILVTEDEARHTREYEDFYKILPEFPFWTEDTFDDQTGLKLPVGFEYRSDSNNQWMNRVEIERIINAYTSAQN